MIIARKTSVRRTNRSEIQNKQSEATVYLYGPIGGWFGIDHQEFVKDFNAIDAGTIHLRIDSEGGDVFSARAMKTAIMQHKAKVIAHIDGLAASAASFLAMGADEIEIVEGGFFMIHRAASLIDILGFFDVDDIQQVIDDLTKEKDLHGKINDSIAADYVKRTGNDLEKVLEWMTAETWFTAKEALENNFADRIYDGEPVEGSYDLSVFANVPDGLEGRNTKLSTRTLEKTLRDAGLSRKEAKTVSSTITALWDAEVSKEQAKALLAEGFKDDQRDVDTPADPPPVDTDQRDVEPEKPKKDRVSDLLIRAEVMAPGN